MLTPPWTWGNWRAEQKLLHKKQTLNSYNFAHADINSLNKDSNRRQYITEKQPAIFHRVLAPPLPLSKVRLPDCPLSFIVRAFVVTASYFLKRNLQKYLRKMRDFKGEKFAKIAAELTLKAFWIGTVILTVHGWLILNSCFNCEF